MGDNGEKKRKMENVLRSAQFVETGRPSIQAANRFGSVQSSAMLFVNQEAVELVSRMPVFLEKIKDVTICELGLSVSFNCTVHGDPSPMLCWLHNGSAVHNNPCIRSRAYEDGSANLDIDVTTNELCGTYTAVATNPFGWAHSSALLKLELSEKTVSTPYTSLVSNIDSMELDRSPGNNLHITL
ncbi:hypothetical protein KIN20_034513 [Parelaphostrongylus tenuis]|uniref:Ig-like domain-containing protein n=1 Tax=Parelaphostrongylus tenuis TaxID=148309 RepID=A0AAD5R9S3_PARTN|nr:hypothetical protein KIN20_034513 [Parelaphostrongylus tenuis]